MLKSASLLKGDPPKKIYEIHCNTLFFLGFCNTKSKAVQKWLVSAICQQHFSQGVWHSPIPHFRKGPGGESAQKPIGSLNCANYSFSSTRSVRSLIILAAKALYHFHH